MNSNFLPRRKLPPIQAIALPLGTGNLDPVGRFVVREKGFNLAQPSPATKPEHVKATG